MPTQRQKIQSTLQEFYSKPVARVSMELFLSVGAVIFFAIFAIRPTLLTISDLINEIEEKEALDQQLTQKIAALSTAQTTYLQIQDRVFLLDQAVPAQPEFLNAVGVIEKVASEQELLVSGITANEIPSEESVEVAADDVSQTVLPISVNVTGSFIDIKAFVEELVQLRRAYVIDTITFSTNEERVQEVWRTTISLGVPYFSEE